MVLCLWCFLFSFHCMKCHPFLWFPLCLFLFRHLISAQFHGHCHHTFVSSSCPLLSSPLASVLTFSSFSSCLFSQWEAGSRAVCVGDVVGETNALGGWTAEETCPGNGAAIRQRRQAFSRSVTTRRQKKTTFEYDYFPAYNPVTIPLLEALLEALEIIC